MSAVFSVQNLQKNYAGVAALQGVHFQLNAGECVAMIGPNGAGKSTCFACLAGQQQPDSGHALWRGQSLLETPPHLRKTRGVARTFQVAQVFEALTVLENLQLVLQVAQGVSAFQALAECQFNSTWAWIDKMGLREWGDQALQSSAAQLSYGQKKCLELCMALAGLPDPTQGLLLLDEPAAGLSSSERQGMMQRIKFLCQTGTTVLYTEHNMDAVFGVADRVLVLMEGQLVAEGLPQEVAAHPLVRERYLGKTFNVSKAGLHA
jgi:branched-chain amino acid transport system ATP-binding protein